MPVGDGVDGATTRPGPRVLIAGGGTTGHVAPGLAAAEVLRARGAEILFVGTSRGPEARLVPAAGYEFRPVPVIGRGPGKLTARNLKAVLLLGLATLRAHRWIRRFRPDVVVGTGGYVSLPAALAARLASVPLVLHEQNSVPGMANRVARRFARAVGVSFPGTEHFFGPGCELVGNPVPAALRDFDRTRMAERGRREFGLEPDLPTLLVFGGSQGAASINDAVVGAFDELRDRPIQILHLAGLRNEAAVSEAIEQAASDTDALRYRVVGYTDRMELAYACSDLALCRSGATSVAELAAVGLPAVLVPLPISLDDDQRKNAEAVVAAGGARMVMNRDLQPKVVVEGVVSLLEDAETLLAMSEAVMTLARPDAAERFADLVEAAAGDRRS